MAHGGRSCEEMAAFTAEAPRRRERAFCSQTSAPPRLCGEKGLRALFHSFGSRGEVAVANASARASGRETRLQWSIISVAPAGAGFLFCFFPPWLSPWATFCRRYAACIRSRFSSLCALTRRMRTRGIDTESRGPHTTEVRGTLAVILNAPYRQI